MTTWNADMWAFAIGVWVAVAVVCAVIAPAKGRDQSQWFVLGLFGGVIALAILLLMPKVEQLATCPQCGWTVRPQRESWCSRCGYRPGFA